MNGAAPTSSELERAKLLIGAHYRSELKRRLEALGYATEQTMVGSVPGFEIAGYDKATLKAFSTRRAEALAWVKERNLDSGSAAVMQQAVLYTRKRKDEPSRQELSGIWKARMAELGTPQPARLPQSPRFPHPARPGALASRAPGCRQPSVPLGPPCGPPGGGASRGAAHGVHREHAARPHPGAGPVDIAGDRRSESAGCARRATSSRPSAARSDLAFVTERAVAAERAVLRWLKKSDAPGRFAIDAGSVERHLEAGTLNDGQKAAVSTLLLSSRHLCGVQGHAGTGKTTMLKQVVELAGAERIVACAPSSSAARTLQQETGIGTKTLQWFLTRYRDVGDGCADA